MGRERTYYVYIMASKGRVLYVGVTGFLMARVLRHRAGEGGEFTEVLCLPAGLLYVVSECRGRDCARDADQDLAAGEEGGAHCGEKSDVGGFGGGVGWGGGDESVGESRFLTGKERRFGMTRDNDKK